MTTHKNLMTLCVAALFTLGLAACGSDGGDDPVTMPDPPPDPTPTPVAVDMSGVTMGYMVTAGTVEIAAGTTMTHGDVDFMCAAGGEACTVMVMGDGTATSTGGTVTAMNSADYQARLTVDEQRMAANNAISMATDAIDALTGMSSDADVDAAQALIDAAKAAVTAGLMLTDDEKVALNGMIASAEVTLGNARTMIAEYRMEQQRQAERGAVNTAITAATDAVGALTNMSTDAEVAAAQSAVDAAEAALAATTVLPANEVFALQARIDAAQVDLDNAETMIVDYRTHQLQYTTAMSAVEAAEMAVNALTSASSDADADAAENLIMTAKAAVTAGTMLTADEMAGLNRRIGGAETNLGTARTAIANRHTHEMQYTTAMNAVTAAEMAVNALTNASTDAEVTAAEGLITAAENAVTEGTMLTASQVADLNGKIAIAKVNLATTETNIVNYRTHQMQLTTAMGAVDDAETAVAALDVDSTDAEVEAAKGLITAAKNAVTEGTMLTPDQRATLNADISSAETSLQTVELQIALRKARDDAERVVRLHGEASGATSDAIAAGNAAKKALEDAEKYDGMIGVIVVNGDSGVAEANAQKVLDAQSAAVQAVLDATAAKTRAQTAKTEATALDDTVPGKVALIAALDDAIEEAEDRIKATTDIRDGDELEDAVEMVTGTDEDDLDDAADRGKDVADAIYTALITAAQLPAVQGDFANIQTPSATVGKAVAGPSDAQGRTFAQIVGASNIVEKRIGTTGGATRLVKAKSVDGMEADDLFSTVPENILTTDGTQIEGADVAYKGIQGILFCAGSDCGVEGTGADRELTGSWYFTDTNNDRTYIAGTTAGTYTWEDPDGKATGYVRYGYWLSVGSGTDDTTTIHRYADGPDAQKEAAVYGISTAIDAFEGASASYEGGAVGMSVVQTFDSKGAETSRASGHFDADVSLTMRFGSTPTLRGTIDNFRGSAVDTDWEVGLDLQTLASGVLSEAGVTDGGGDPGTWSATAWGGSETSGEEARPTGVYGVFDADFTNGAAAGVYSTRKE